MKGFKVLLCASVILGAVTLLGFKIAEEKDQATGSTKIAMVESDSVASDSHYDIKFMGVASVAQTGTKAYFLLVKCQTYESSGLFSNRNVNPVTITEGEETLTLTIDGESSKFKGSGFTKTDTKVFHGTQHDAYITYAADADLLKKLRDAKEVKYDLITGNGTLSGKFPPGLQKQFGEFCKHCGIV